MQQTHRDSWRRRIPFYLLVCGMAALVAQYLGQQPVEVQVAYHYGALGAGLQAASLEYHRADEVVARASFGYRERPASRVQRHTIRLPRGDYSVFIELRYHEASQADKAAHQLERVDVADDRAVSVKRPLIVREEGQSHIYF